MSIMNLDTVSTAMLLTLASAGEPEQMHVCSFVAEPPSIEINVTTDDVDFDNQKDMDKLTELQAQMPSSARYNHSPQDGDSHDTEPNWVHAKVGGMMAASLRMEHKVAFKQRIDRNTGKGCVWIDNVTVELKLDPTIYIANDFRDDACRHKEILEHEMQHLEVDRDITDKYSAQMSDALNLILSGPDDYKTGLIPANDIERNQSVLSDNVEGALDVMFDKMAIERAERQAAIDTPEEYRRISGSCPRS